MTELSDRLRHSTPEITAGLERALQEHEFSASPPALLAPYLPAFLSELAQAVDRQISPPPPIASSDGSYDPTASTGETCESETDRRRQALGVNPVRACYELGRLRETIFAVLERETPLAPPDRDAINASLDEELREILSRYVQSSEQHIRTIREEYLFLVDQIRDYAIIALDHEGHIISWNRGADRLYGYPAEEALGSHFSLLFTPEDRKQEIPQKSLEDSLRGNVENEGWRIRQDGSRFWALNSLTPLYNEAGNLWGYSKIARDMTERREQEETLRFQKSLLQAQSEASIDGVLIVSQDRKIISYNRQFVELWHLPDEILETESDEPLLHFVLDQVVNPDEFMQKVEFLSDRPEEKSHTEIRLRDERTFDMYCAPIHSEAGDTYGRIWFIRDITERKQAEATLRNVLHHARCILWSAEIREVEGVPQWSGHVFDPEAAQQILPLEVPAGRDYTDAWYECRHSEDRERMDGDSYHALISGLSSYRQEFRCTNRYGQQQWMMEDVSLRRLDANRWGAVGVCTDITERKKIEQQLLQSQKMEAVGQFAGGVAHDFNNLLSVINGFSELLLSRLPPDDPMAKSLEQILKAGERGAAMTRQLLAFSRRQFLTPKIVDLNDLVQQLLQILQRLIGEDIEMQTSLAPNLGRVRVDPGQIEQAIMNLAANARDAMPSGGRLCLETANVEVREADPERYGSLTPGAYVSLTVRDNGVGIEPEVLKRIFEPFFTTKETGKGTGLGLATAYGTVQQSGGVLWAESAPGQGSAFHIYLPRVAGEAEIESRPITNEMAHGTETLLLVEDDPMVRGFTKQLLEECGYTVLEAGHGDEALSLAQEHEGKIQLLLTDVVLPRMSGPDLAQRIRRLLPETKVIFMSGYTDDARVRQEVEKATTPFLQKPFSPVALTQKVRELLDQ